MVEQLGEAESVIMQRWPYYINLLPKREETLLGTNTALDSFRPRYVGVFVGKCFVPDPCAVAIVSIDQLVKNNSTYMCSGCVH